MRQRTVEQICTSMRNTIEQPATPDTSKSGIPSLEAALFWRFRKLVAAALLIGAGMLAGHYVTRVDYEHRLQEVKQKAIAEYHEQHDKEIKLLDRLGYSWEDGMYSNDDSCERRFWDQIELATKEYRAGHGLPPIQTTPVVQAQCSQ